MISRKTADFLRMALTQLIAEARQSYNAHNIANMNFTTMVSGRTAGDLAVTFSFSESSYGSNAASSHDPAAALEEILRRHGWSKENSCLLLSYSGDEKVEAKEDQDLTY